ncbi:DUF3267 domain-containing protein [Paenibacillus albidus]|uniref:metalloprotease family protein n=1 Tax=Paenibacillus albidus TaxID=2041023 RepID=UPI001BE8E30F|nr:metalloprotease family protein [Paenibacillus albidus]MBT2293059.1 DUF3267 domain-containing protein [Paenibacillus albidus]
MIIISQKEKRTKAIYRWIGAFLFIVVFVTCTIIGFHNLGNRLMDFSTNFIQGIVLILLSTAVLTYFHEVIHRTLLLGSKKAGKVDLHFDCVTFDGKVSKFRYVFHTIAPFLLIPVALAFLTYYSPGYIAIIATLIFAQQTAACSSDLYSFYITLKHWNRIDYITDDKEHVYFHLHVK